MREHGVQLHCGLHMAKRTFFFPSSRTEKEGDSLKVTARDPGQILSELPIPRIRLSLPSHTPFTAPQLCLRAVQTASFGCYIFCFLN